jgi:tetratricopeptide (TPR) repeat protein
MYKRAMAIDLKVVGPNHADIGADLNCLAELYSAQGKYAQAEPLYKSSLSILEKAYGPKHPNIATVLNNYAAVLRKTNRAKEAAALEARAEAMRPIR